MRTRVFLPFLTLASLILMAGLACSLTPSVPATAVVNPPANPTSQPAQPTVIPTLSPPTEPPPTATEAAPDYFTEHFTSSTLPDWSYFLTRGDEKDMTLTSGNSILKFDLEGKNVWVYLMYDPISYKDVRIEARAENRGLNDNNVSLICRYSNEGWYEFNVANNGLYWIYAYTEADKTYHAIYTGGSTAIRMGKDVNDYTVTCSGTTLTLNINGTEVRKVEDKSYKLRDGQIGIGVSSFDTWPIVVEWDYVTISQP